MGKGKGSFDHWAARVAVSQIVFEIRTTAHEQVVRDAYRLAACKLPGKLAFCFALGNEILTPFSIGQWEVVKKGEPPVVGITKLDGVTLEELKRPWMKFRTPQVASTPSTAATTSSPTPPAP